MLLTPTGAHATGRSAADSKPAVTLSGKQAGKGGEITVKGTGWRSDTLLMMLVCGRSSPDRGVIGGTNSCANADGRAVTTDSKGAFSKKLPVAEPPVPCPCVVHVATVTGDQSVADAAFVVAGHPVAALPKEDGNGKLAVLATTRLEGDSGILTWFGAPPSRRLVLTVGNLGSAPVKDPVFQVGTAHGVYAPQWEERQWRGTVEPGRKARIELPVELTAGAHGDYQVSLKYGTKVLAEQPWGVGRPWGVTLFWILLCLVVPAAVFRIGMAVVDKVRPRSAHAAARPRRRPDRFTEVTARLPKLRRAPAPSEGPAPAAGTGGTTTAALPWFTPDSAPSEHRPTTKGHS
uniref:Neocarzinostatin family protein n=1 Tax=Streptomyces sp. NBC_00008 TaxID=2903610 RepID=A0AAU2W4L2_9ACTN